MLNLQRITSLTIVALLSSVAGPSSEASPPASDTKTLSAERAPSKAAGPVADSKEVRALLARGIKLSKRKKQNKAIAVFVDVLTRSPQHPQALYVLAKSQYLSKDKEACLLTLERLAASKDERMPRHRIAARADKVFAELRADLRFRKAVGIDPDPKRPLSAFERLMAMGGHWEQDAIPCEQPGVVLELETKKKKDRFDLVIRSNCQGLKETTRLDGSWRSVGSDALRLRFPNTQSAAEELVCKLERCIDANDEDCLRCQPEPDMEFLLRVVRRTLQ